MTGRLIGSGDQGRALNTGAFLMTGTRMLPTFFFARGGGDRSSAAAHCLSVDDDGLTVVDRDRIAVLVGVGAACTAGGSVDGLGLRGGRGEGENCEGAEERGGVLEAGLGGG